MKLKNILMFIVILLLAGCTPKYELEINSNHISEKLTISQIPNNYTENDFENRLAIPEDDKYYNTSFSNGVATYSYGYNLSNVSKSNMINSCFDAYKFYQKDDYYALQTGSKFMCYPLQINDFTFAKYNTLDIIIKINDFEVIENNADVVENNEYRWTINSKNYNNKSILIKFKNINKTPIEEKKDKSSVDLKVILMVVVGIMLVILIIILYALNLNKKRNKL